MAQLVAQLVLRRESSAWSWSKRLDVKKFTRFYGGLKKMRGIKGGMRGLGNGDGKTRWVTSQRIYDDDVATISLASFATFAW